MAATLVEELVEEILIRIPPDEPAQLVHAAVVCKSWHRILSDTGFRRRYRKFHRTPPLLGYIQNYKHDRYQARFLPTTTTTSPVSISMAALMRTLDRSHWTALDSRHGRVLIYIDDLIMITPRLIVWDPITGGQQHLSVPLYQISACYPQCTGSVLCATNDCDHLDCGNGPFAVVFVWAMMNNPWEDMAIWVSIYSSETGAWSVPTSININYCHLDRIPGVFIRDALYFTIGVSRQGLSILKYDLHNHGLSVIDARCVTTPTFVMEGDDQTVQLVTLSDDNCIDIWSSQQDTNGICGWVKHKAMELPVHLLKHGSFLSEVIGFVEGMDIVLISTTYDGILTVNLKSRQMRKIYEGATSYVCSVLPYMSFYTPR